MSLSSSSNRHNPISLRKCDVGIHVSLLFVYQEIIILEMTDFSMLMVSSGCKGTILWEELLGELLVDIIIQNYLYNWLHISAWLA